ncbi:hypothetical protein E4U22_004724 [Claviceps purpurea]|nr:hypothetical protein E4U35_000614 [Claviceps purpurea]KAG6319280.1 hypothetical protein E4U22_004724 [Claviceps purpurea]
MVRLVTDRGVSRQNRVYSVCRLQSSGCPKSRSPKSNSARSTVRSVPQRVAAAKRSPWSRAEGLRRSGRRYRTVILRTVLAMHLYAPSGRYQLSFSVWTSPGPQVSDMLAGGTNHIGSRHLHPPESKFFLPQPVQPRPSA